ncbi:hypothetical protein [Reinekea sp. G2M2-21]|uniref:hypothetical protein n=1 Tax=Reinekea sp. G2M2-21 TaxID=2788942 RepID=UPI0018AA2735|nr:hypothetical protein [Reinekea sp. G2M2-21]
MQTDFIFLRNKTVVWGRENFDRLGRTLNIDSGEYEVFLSNESGGKLKLDMRYISPVLQTDLEKSFSEAANTYQSKVTSYWGLYLPVRAKSIDAALSHIPLAARKAKGPYAPKQSMLERFYINHEDGGVVISGLGRKVRTQSAAEYFASVDRLTIPFQQVMAAFEKQIVPTLERNPLIALERNETLSVAELDMLQQAIDSTPEPIQAARLALERLAEMPDGLAATLFLSYPDKDILRLISSNPQLRMTKPLIEQIMHTSRRPLLEFQVPSSWVSVATVVQIANSIMTHRDLKLAEKYSRWKPVVNSPNRHIALCRDNIIDLIANLSQRNSA